MATKTKAIEVKVDERLAEASTDLRPPCRLRWSDPAKPEFDPTPAEATATVA